jgi:Xaa-Pro dipeptidase
MECKTPASELRNRMERFRDRMDAENPLWEFAAIFGRVNQFYFTGTMQDAVLLIPRGDEAVLWVRRSYERALDESLFPRYRPMKSFRDAAAGMGACPGRSTSRRRRCPLRCSNGSGKHFPFMGRRRRSMHRQRRSGRGRAPTNLRSWSRRGGSTGTSSKTAFPGCSGKG